MSQLKKSAKSVGMIAVITLGSKVLGFVREAMIAARYGSGVGTDTFFIALSAISLFSVILTQTINTTLIPILADVEAHEGKEGKKNHFNNFFNTMTLAAILLSILAYFIAPLIMKVLAKGFEGEQFQHAISMMRLGIPILIFTTMVGALNAYLQTEERFTETALISYPWNMIYIVFLLFFAERFSITGLMVIAVVAEASKLLVPIPGLKDLSYRYKFVLDLKDDYMKQMAYLIPPVLLSVGISDVNSIVDRSMASSLVDGSVSSLNYANTLKGIIYSIFVTAILTVVFPILSKEANEENYARLKKVMQTSMNIVLLILIPAMIGMIILSAPAVKFAYQRGEFGDRAAWMTQTALIAYSLGLIGMGVRALLVRMFYALQDTKTPMVNSVYALVFNVLFNLLFVRFIGHSGLALATSLTTTLTGLLLLYELRKKIGPLGLRAMVNSTVKILLSSLLMGVIIYILYHGGMAYLDPSRLIELFLLLITGMIGVAVYFIGLYLFQVEELHFLVDQVKGRFKK